MATHLCPKCKHDSFAWSYDADQSPTTYWGCVDCGYGAYEDESFERDCNECETKTEIRLDDKIEIYWWCSRCNKITIIER